ncbi:MAG: FG-GAP repeat domain-containing protein, partial [Mycobacteriales bacterium]
MPSLRTGAFRRLVPGVFVLILVAALYLVARLPEASAGTRAEMAARFHFTEQHIALPPGLPHRHIRQVNPAYKKLQAWVSSVGAGIAVSDLAGRGVAGDLCVVDSRSDSVIVTPAPNTGKRYASFVLNSAPLPVDDTMAPAGCVPGDFNSDGRMDLLVYYLGRTPILYLARPGATRLAPDAFVPTELVPQGGSDGRYHGAPWQTQAAAIADFDGDGHVDIGVFNYWPDSAVLDPHGRPDVQMNHSMSRAENGGGAHILRWTGNGDTGGTPTVRFEEQADAIPPGDATGWTLAAASADLDGDLLPELYIANDFGHDHLFHNASTPGHIRFTPVMGSRGPMTPKSMVLGHDSFKGMGVDFGDLNDNGRLDAFVSNITTPFAL